MSEVIGNTPPLGGVFFVTARMCIYGAVRKNLTQIQLCVRIRMADTNYYKKNRGKRIQYQKEYYEKNKEAIKRKREIKKAVDPDFTEKQRKYNKNYYRENKERIRRGRLKRAAALWSQIDNQESLAENN